jgi:hypothetical protein
MTSISHSKKRKYIDLPELRIDIKKGRFHSAPEKYQDIKISEEKKDVVDISIGIDQISKGEDIIPRHKVLHNNDIFIVGDGHGGKGCKEIIDRNVDLLMNLAFLIGTKEAMKRAIELCKLEESGAMLIIAKYNRETCELTSSSIGDAFFGVYSNNKCIFKQPVHKCDDIEKLGTKMIKRVERGKGVIRPSPCGKILSVDFNESKIYYQFANNLQIATTASLGHNGFDCMSPITEHLKIDKKDFHFVFSSDGVTDVINPEDKLFLEHNSAEKIVTEARKRWLGNYWEMHYKNFRGMFSGIQSNRVYAKSPRFADDCTVLVAGYKC